MSLKVEVRPIERKTWHGKTGHESFKRPVKLKALVDGDTMEYATGMSPEEIKEYSEILGQNLSPIFNPDTPHPFWDSAMATINLENSTLFLDPQRPIEFVKIKFMKASRFVANSMREYEQGLFPDATHVISDEREEVDAKASKIEMKKNAVIKSAGLGKERKISLIMVLGGKNLKGKSDNFIEVELDKIVQGQAREVLRHIDMDAEDVSAHALVLECLQKSVLMKQGHKIFYHDNFLGGDVLDVITYLKQPDNQQLKLRLMAAVND